MTAWVSVEFRRIGVGGMNWTNANELITPRKSRVSGAVERAFLIIVILGVFAGPVCRLSYVVRVAGVSVEAARCA